MVLRHLEEQLEYLRDASPNARACVLRIYEDERAHHDTSEGQMSRDGWLTRALIAIVQLCTETVIKIGMR